MVYIINTGHNYEWFIIIRALSGLDKWARLGLYDRNIINEFVGKIAKIKQIAKYFLKCIYILVFFYIITVIILLMSVTEILLYGLLSGVLYLHMVYSVYQTTVYCFLYYYIICRFSQICVKQFNSRMRSLVLNKCFMNRKMLIKLLREHNTICNDLHKYNSFWKDYYFCVVYSIIPICLIYSHMILFQKISSLFGFIAMILVDITFLLTLLSINLITASINSETLKTYRILHNISIKTQIFKRFADRFKVLSKKYTTYLHNIRNIFVIFSNICDNSW